MAKGLTSRIQQRAENQGIPTISSPGPTTIMPSIDARPRTSWAPSPWWLRLVWQSNVSTIASVYSFSHSSNTFNMCICQREKSYLSQGRGTEEEIWLIGLRSVEIENRLVNVRVTKKDTWEHIFVPKCSLIKHYRSFFQIQLLFYVFDGILSKLLLEAFCLVNDHNSIA